MYLRFTLHFFRLKFQVDHCNLVFLFLFLFFSYCTHQLLLPSFPFLIYLGIHLFCLGH